jgi:hypothetical protein
MPYSLYMPSAYVICPIYALFDALCPIYAFALSMPYSRSMLYALLMSYALSLPYALFMVYVPMYA